ncbi:MAG: helix-hairpin-helix domain-containing protein [Candidatus Bathyarchaeota archaeon]|nr:helix-hairpin-helix domain-containing protein [Candidatus Bathyarchaeota archaeon]
MSNPGYNPEDITGGGDKDTGVSMPVSEAVSQQVSIETNSVNVAEARSSQVSVVPSINGSEERETYIVAEADRAKASKRKGLRMIRGIGEKREEKLMSVGIRTIEDLAEADPKDLAVKLGISLKLTSAWVEEAKLIVSRKNV